jgi:hypothetical protein
MGEPDRIIAAVYGAFGSCPKPEHFCNPSHCEECATYDALLRARDRNSITLDDLENHIDDPFCFCSPQGLAYYFPALARFALLPPDAEGDWYAERLAFHIYYGNIFNEFFLACSATQRQAVADLLAHLVESIPAGVDDESASHVQRAHTLWHGS